MNNDQFWRTRNLKSQVTALRKVPISHYSAVLGTADPAGPTRVHALRPAGRPITTVYSG
jgi:hypothetical protein